MLEIRIKIYLKKMKNKQCRKRYEYQIGKKFLKFSETKVSFLQKCNRCR